MACDENQSTAGQVDPLSRRSFVALAAGAVAACSCACESALAADGESASSRGRGDKEDPNAPKQIDVGPLADFKEDGVKLDWAKPNRFLIVRDQGRLYAPSSVCTHKHCILKIKNDIIVCPCHGSKYSNDGIPYSGPAKMSLFRYAVSVDDKGHVIVDKTKQFEEKKWDDAAASIKIT